MNVTLGVAESEARFIRALPDPSKREQCIVVLADEVHRLNGLLDSIRDLHDDAEAEGEYVPSSYLWDVLQEWQEG